MRIFSFGHFFFKTNGKDLLIAELKSYGLVLFVFIDSKWWFFQFWTVCCTKDDKFYDLPQFFDILQT